LGMAGTARGGVSSSSCACGVRPRAPQVPTSVLVRARHPIFCYKNRMSSVRASSLDLAGAAAAAGEAGGAEGGLLPMKLGSLQEFVHHECDTSEMGPSRFSARDVHHIGILDVRLFNTDRHAGNMLVRTSKESCGNLAARIVDSGYELVPIDHGFCLPEMLEAPYFEWLHWPQAMLPFTEDELAYIRGLDFEVGASFWLGAICCDTGLLMHSLSLLIGALIRHLLEKGGVGHLLQLHAGVRGLPAMYHPCARPALMHMLSAPMHAAGRQGAAGQGNSPPEARVRPRAGADHRTAQALCRRRHDPL
jgi:hypothetical protein